jgi:hypothetical protein
MEFASSWSENVPSDRHMDWSIGLIIAFTMLFTAMIQTVFLHQYFHVCLVTGMRVKTAIASAVYAKSLRLSNSSRQSSTTGEIVNLMSVDAGRIADLWYKRKGGGNWRFNSHPLFPFKLLSTYRLVGSFPNFVGTILFA